MNQYESALIHISTFDDYLILVVCNNVYQYVIDTCQGGDYTCQGGTIPVKAVTIPVKAVTIPVKAVTIPVKAVTISVKAVTIPVKAVTISHNRAIGLKLGYISSMILLP